MNVALSCWGNYPRFPQHPTACHWRSDLPQLLARVCLEHETTLPFGAGLSYGDSCLASSDQVLHMRPLDRFIAADWSTGTVTAEAGVTLEEIHSLAVPHGWFLAVTPGTKYITLGGAIANDVHGKNHHRRGTFGRHVRRLGLLRSDIGRLTCSPEESGDLFDATIGGLGLTGLIEWAEIRMMPVRSSVIDRVIQRFNDVDEFFSLSAELEAKHEFCVSWIDCAERGKAIGRGVCMAGDFSSDGPLTVAAPRRLTVPFTPAVSIFNRHTVRAFNAFYWRKAPSIRTAARIGFDPYFYPLDVVLKWNRMYGPLGFQQYQALIPEAESRAGIHALLDTIAASGSGSFLAVLKRFGTLPSPGILSFPQAGTTLALDFPQADKPGVKLFPRLDAIVRETGGRIYPAKDAHMSGEDFRRGYPAWETLEARRDPALMSRFWKRVTG